ncbi:crispr-associated protein, family [Thermosipho africanus TCF52B]|uniref:Crispr-associated protein, family n=1 Tax=Thermosipho africanus (strain TCF52B) TaxID=484019 RepID=B7IFF2_THEAB|nr:CRISPR-associated CARF protein Csx1 [Thermosipho africanus]ACJ74816.1 crispr-associated protein, family [Thermosipho africanus TCF52B]
MKLFFSTFGKISNYKEVEYSIDYNENTFESPFLPDLMCKAFGVDTTELFLLDTLVEKNDLLKEDFKYEDIITSLENKYFNYFKSKDYKGNLNLHIIPGVGSYKEFRFVGNMNDTYYMTLIQLLNIFSRPEVINSEEIEVILDISFGINYQSNVLYRTLMDILPVLAYFKKVRFKLTNAEPVINTSAEGKNKINVYVVEEKVFEQSISYKKDFAKKTISVFRGLSINERKEVGKNYIREFEKRLRNEKNMGLNNVFLNLELYLKSIYYGLPLLYLYAMNGADFKYVVDKSLEMYNSAIEIRDSNENLKMVLRKLEFSEGIKYLVLGSIFKIYFENIYGTKYCTEIPYDELKKLSNFIWKIDEFKNQISLVLEKEIKEIESLFDYIEEGEEILFDLEMLKSRKNESIECEEKVDENTKKELEHENDELKKQNSIENFSRKERNFIAHGSLSKNTFYLKKYNSMVCIRLNEEEICKLGKAI